MSEQVGEAARDAETLDVMGGLRDMMENITEGLLIDGKPMAYAVIIWPEGEAGIESINYLSSIPADRRGEVLSVMLALAVRWHPKPTN